MSFKIEFSKQATKLIKNLSEDIKGRIKKKFSEISENPFRYLEHFEGKDVYKLRIGDYRALVDVDFQNKILKIQVFDKRGRVYK